MAIPFGRWSFAAGEMAPGFFGHIDFAKYQIGLSTCRNAFISYRGGAYSRAGTAFVGYSKQTTAGALPPRLITFQFNVNQGFALEFGNFYMRVVSDGGFVLEAPFNISAVTNSSPASITAAGNQFADGDWVYVTGVGGMPMLDGQTYKVGVSGSTFEIFDIFGNAINSTAFGAYAGGGTVARVYTLVTPWAEADLEYLKFTQSADVMSLCCWNQVTGTSYPAYDLERITDTDWTLTAFSAASSIAAPASCTVTASTAASGSNPATQYLCVVTAVDQITGEESQASPFGAATNSVDISSTAGSLTIGWATVAGAGYYNIYQAPPAISANVPAGSLYGYLGTAYGNQFVDSNITADFSQVPPLHLDPFQPGQVLYVTVTSGGSGLSGVSYSFATAAGTGAEGYGVIVGGVLVSFVITNPGMLYQPGDAIIFDGAGFAAGAIEFAASGNPSVGDTITLNGVVWTFVAGSAGVAQTTIQPTLAETLDALAANLNASSNASLTVATYTALPGIGPNYLEITYDTVGAGGDSYTLAASAATPSGPHLAGGSGSGVIAGELVIGPEAGTYPSVVAYFQQRRFYAASPNNPDTYWASQPGAFNNFDARIPTIDSDSITGTPWSVQVNGIQAMVPMPGGLVVLTGRQAWQLGGAGSSSISPQAITPANQQAQPQAFNGCSATMPPIQKDFDIVYPQNLGSIFRDLSYNFFTNIYTGVDVTYLSSHLFNGLLMREWAWCEEPNKIIWVVRADGILLSFTFFKEQDVLAWTRHDTTGLYCSVTAVTEPPVDALYLATERVINGQNSFMIERMDNRVWNGIETVWCVDAGLSLAQPQPAAAMAINSLSGAGAVDGIIFFTGGNNYSAATYAVVPDPTGSGATFGLTIIAGVIQLPAITNGGGNYTRPGPIQFIDPTGSGTGASGGVLLNNSAIVTTNVPIFNGAMVDWVIRGVSGIATITAVNSTTNVTVNVTQPFQTTEFGVGFATVQAGSWTLTEPTSTLIAPHLAGALVTGVADGLVITPRVAAAGGVITLDTPVTSAVVGLGFQVQMQTLRMESGQPTAQGQRKVIAGVTARVESSLGFEIGVNQPDGSAQSPQQLAPLWSGMHPAPPPDAPAGLAPYGSLIAPLYTDDVRVPTVSGWNKHGQVALQQNNPLPLQLLAVIPEFLEGDMPEINVSPRPPGSQAGAKGWTV